MPRSLLAVSVGPVQEFIAAARRTRDFWMGSAIVSECAKAVAGLLYGRFGRDLLIFPAVRDASDLSPIEFDQTNSQLTQKFDVANVILSIVPADVDPRALAAELKEAARNRWRHIATRSAEICRHELRPRWDAQLTVSPIEFYAAWSALDESDYAQSRGTVMRLLAGRKAYRDFEPWPGESGIPKSSLDGARESVLSRSGGDARRRRGLRVKPAEELDLIGIVKRVDWGHDAIRYPSVSRIAVDPWIRGVERAAVAEPQLATLFERVKNACADLGLRQRRMRNRNAEDDCVKFPWLRPFPFEGVALYASRRDDLLDELVEDWRDDAGPPEWKRAVDEAKSGIAGLRELVEQLRRTLARLRRRPGSAEPWEYLAVLAADGDRIGRTLSDLSGVEDGIGSHREFSLRQSEFATEARLLINERFPGACVYASADDVLAFVAVDRAVECAVKLRALFDEKVGGYVRRFPNIKPPTLSVGIAIGHFMEPLEDLLDDARDAEKRAKDPSPAEENREQRPRNALAVTVHARGGVSFTVRDNWDRGSIPIDGRIDDWARMHVARQVPSKAAYDLRQVAIAHKASSAEAIRADALRVLARKRAARGGESVLEQIRELILPVSHADDLHAVANELLVGQWIGGAMSQASGESMTTGDDE